MTIKKVGEYYRSLSTFSIEGNKFIKGSDYQLIDIEENELFTLYFFIRDGQSFLYGDCNGNFDDHFSLRQNERVKLINQLLYQD